MFSSWLPGRFSPPIQWLRSILWDKPDGSHFFRSWDTSCGTVVIYPTGCYSPNLACFFQSHVIHTAPPYCHIIIRTLEYNKLSSTSQAKNYQNGSHKEEFFNRGCYFLNLSLDIMTKRQQSMTNSTFFLIYHDISSNSHYPAELHVITPIYIMRKPQHLSSITTYRICRWLQIYI